MNNFEKEMIRILNAYEGGDELISNQGQALDGYSALANFVELARRIKQEYENKSSKHKNL